jgi:hypothetical protein
VTGCERGFLWFVTIPAAVLVASPAATAPKPQAIASYCSQTGDLCFGVLNRDGAVSLEITTVERYFGRYTLCVKPPRGASSCRGFPIRYTGKIFASRVRWYGHFPARGPGAYVVTWKSSTSPLGPRLTFRLPL